MCLMTDSIFLHLYFNMSHSNVCKVGHMWWRLERSGRSTVFSPPSSCIYEVSQEMAGFSGSVLQYYWFLRARRICFLSAHGSPKPESGFRFIMQTETTQQDKGGRKRNKKGRKCHQCQFKYSNLLLDCLHAHKSLSLERSVFLRPNKSKKEQGKNPAVVCMPR